MYTNTTHSSRTARSDQNTSRCHKTCNKTVTGYIFYHSITQVKYYKQTRKLEKNQPFQCYWPSEKHLKMFMIQSDHFFRLCATLLAPRMGTWRPAISSEVWTSVPMPLDAAASDSKSPLRQLWKRSARKKIHYQQYERATASRQNERHFWQMFT